MVISSPIQTTPKVPILSKEEFVSICNFMNDKDDKFRALVASACDLCPGFYVDFYPNCDYNELIIKLLNAIFGYDTSEHNGSSSAAYDTPINYYFYEARVLQSFSDDVPPEYSSPEALYDYLIKCRQEELPPTPEQAATENTEKKGDSQNVRQPQQQ